MQAARAGDVARVRGLLPHVDLPTMARRKLLPLHEAMVNGHDAVVSTIVRHGLRPNEVPPAVPHARAAVACDPDEPLPPYDEALPPDYGDAEGADVPDGMVRRDTASSGATVGSGSSWPLLSRASSRTSLDSIEGEKRAPADPASGKR